MAVSRALTDYVLDTGNTIESKTIDKIGIRSPLVKYYSPTRRELPPEENPSLMINIPYLSAKMNAVTSPKLAVALAQYGGLGVLPGNQTIDAQAAMVREVKGYKAGFVVPEVVSSNMTIVELARLSEERGYSTFPVTEDGTLDGKVVGYITKNDYYVKRDSRLRVKDKMRRFSYERTSDGVFFAWGDEVDGNLSKANSILIQSAHGSLPIVSRADGTIKYIVFRKDIDRHLENPNELTDNHKRYMVGAGANTKDYTERVPALVGAGTDIIFFDNSDGFGFFTRDAANYMHEHYTGFPFSVGNFITEAGARFAIEECKPYLIAVGTGIGSICISTDKLAIGSGQATAIQRVAKVRNEHFARTGEYIPITADGGIAREVLKKKRGDKKEEALELDEGYYIAVALALGADSVMMGRYFARFEESPAPMRQLDVKIHGIPFKAYVKEYWGAGSDREQSWREERYHQRLVQEGIESVVPYAGPMKPVLDVTTEALKSTMMHCGAQNIAELHASKLYRLRSSQAKKEGKPHSVVEDLMLALR